jgi:thiamine biosynthesis protein ThiC
MAVDLPTLHDVDSGLIASCPAATAPAGDLVHGTGTARWWLSLKMSKRQLRSQISWHSGETPARVEVT